VYQYYLEQAPKTLRALGVDGISLTQSMSDFYLLERLTADGSPRARRMLDQFERALAPRLLHYVAFACGGELRHLPNQGDEDEPCFDEMLECGCYYSDHEGNYMSGCDGDHDPDEECEPDQYYCGWEGPGDPGPWGCECWRCGGWRDESWRDHVSEEMEEYITRTMDDGAGRNKSWRTWISFAKQLGLARALAHAVPAFEEHLWQSGAYGGPAWQTAAKVARDFAMRKVSARLFIDRCWTLQHNGGALFDKVWDHEHCIELQSLLQEQADDNYAPLARRASSEVRALWRVRDWHLSGRKDREAEWLGVQPTWDTEVEW
jgi:hypothetical protein